MDTLYDVIKSKKRNHNYSEKLIEEIMYKYLELCVDLKKSHVAKEGLFQYRNMCQSVNVASLASVVQVSLSGLCRYNLFLDSAVPSFVVLTMHVVNPIILLCSKSCVVQCRYGIC